MKEQSEGWTTSGDEDEGDPRYRHTDKLGKCVYVHYSRESKTLCDGRKISKAHWLHEPDMTGDIWRYACPECWRLRKIELGIKTEWDI